MQEKEGGDGVKQILVILGGGRRNGNTKQLADSFVSGAAQAGHQVETIALSEIEVKGCLGCNACRYGKPCVQPDDLIVLFRNSKRLTWLYLLPRCTFGQSRPNSKRLSRDFIALPREMKRRLTAGTRSIL